MYNMFRITRLKVIRDWSYTELIPQEIKIETGCRWYNDYGKKRSSLKTSESRAQWEDVKKKIPPVKQFGGGGSKNLGREKLSMKETQKPRV